MIHDLKPYPAYKDSGVPWLGQVPENWDVLPALAVYRPRLVKNAGMAEKTVLSLSYGRIIVKPEEKLRGLVPESFETYQVVEPGNIIVRTTDLQNDQTSLRVGHVRNRGIITSAYMCLETTERISHRFGYEFLNTYDLLKIIYGFGSGLRQNLDFGQIRRMPVLVPPEGEQSAIVRFLDHADRRIRRYIHAKKKLIALLNEQKQAIIHRAVTRGLDPNVRLKPSGVEWLGEVPEHWSLSRLKFEASHIIDCLHATPEYVAGGEYPAIRTADIEPGRVRLATARKVSRNQYQLWTGRLAPVAGDILYSREGERFGIAALVPEGVSLCISQRMMVFRIRPAQRSDFVMWQLNSGHVYSQAAADVIGSTSPHVNVERIKNYWIVLPPHGEQEAIAVRLAAESARIQRTVQQIERDLALIREYHTRLIADVVTGKLDVREAAARLPDEAEETEPLDEGEAMGEDEEEGAGAGFDGLSEEAVG